MVIEITLWISVFKTGLRKPGCYLVSWHWVPHQKVYSKIYLKAIVRWGTLLRPGFKSKITTQPKICAWDGEQRSAGCLKSATWCL
jgi:hypothetical protein